MVAVSFRNTHKEFPDGYVGVDRLNLDIEEGEFLVLLGPSGCGKSTTLRLLAGLEDVTDGEILIDGIKVNDLPAAARGLGMVFQSYALYPHMTVRDNLIFGLRMANRRVRLDEAEIQLRMNEVSELLTLEKELDKKPKELSGGQRQRVAIGRALVRRPRVLLMDEPLSNLDAKLRNRMRRELRRLHEQHGTTTVYVTHDQVEAMTLADRVAIMSQGKLQQHASPQDAYHKPANAFVASFLGTPAMNLIEGSAKDGVFTAGELNIPLPDHLKHHTGQGIYGIRPEYARIAPTNGIPATIDSVENLGGESVFNLDVMGHPVRILYHRSGAEARNYEDVISDGKVQLDLSVPSAVFFEV